MAGKIKGITVEIGGDSTKLDKALKDSKQHSKDLQKELKGVNSLLKFDPKNTELLSQKQKLLTQSVDETKNRLNMLKEAQAQVTAQYEKGDIGEEAYRDFQREIINTEQQLKKLEKEVDSFGSVGAQKVAAVGESMKDVGGKVENAGKKMSVISAGIVAVGGASVKLASNFEDTMAKVATIADTSETSLDELKTQITELSNQTGISADEIADATYNAISAGQDTADAVNFVSNATSLARAGFADTGASIDLLTTIMNAYGLEASEVSKVSDILIQTQNKGKTTVAELSSAMGKVIPTANSMNVNLENLAAGYSIMTAKGIATAESTTYMNSMLNELGKSGTTVSDALKEKTGKSFQELMESGSSLGDVLQILQNHAKETGVNFNDLWGSAEAGKAGITLLSDGADSFNEAVKGMGESAGATAQAIEKLETPSQKAKVAINEVKNTGIELGNTILTMLQPAIKSISEKVKSFSTWFSGLSDGSKKLIVIIAGIVASIGPALLIAGKVITTVGTILTYAPKIKAAITLVKAAASGLFTTLSANPIGIVIAAVAALVAVFVGLYQHNEKFRNFVDGIVEKIKNVIGALPEWFHEKIEAIKAKFTEFKDGITNTFTNIKDRVSEKATEISDSLRNKFDEAKNAVNEKLTDVKNIVGTVMTAAKDTVSEKLSNIHNAFVSNGGGIKGAAAAAWEGIKGYYTTGFTFIDNLTGGKLSAIADSFKTKMDSIKGTVSAGLEKVKNFFSGLSLKLPHINLPHFRLTGSFSLKPPSVPKLSVDWYAKAAADGMELTRATIFGMNAKGQPMGGGETVPETIVGTDSLMNKINTAVRTAMSEITLGVYMDGDDVADHLVGRLDNRFGILQAQKARGSR